MRPGKMLWSGDVLLVRAQFKDTDELKVRPALVISEELGNVVIAGITSNLKMKGVPGLEGTSCPPF
jgi:mRNA interferase MazF